MDKKDSSHRAQHNRKSTEMTADDVMVRFSPEVLRGLTRLEAAVHDSKHFSPDILENLQDYMTGRPISVQRALTAMVFFAREAMEHINATGDERTKRALDGFISDLLGQTDTPPVTILPTRTKSR